MYTFPMVGTRRCAGLLLAAIFLLYICAAPGAAQAGGRSAGVHDDPAAAEFSRLRELLSGYLAHNLELKKSVLTAQSKALSLKSARIENGVALTLASGDMKIQWSEDKRKITVSPNATLEIPQANGTTIAANFPVTSYDGEETVDNASVSITTGIITNARKKRKVALLEAERALVEAERGVQERALTTEKEFYENLKKLYTSAISVLTAKNDLFDDTVSLRVLTAQGYSRTSAAYRQANLKVESDRRDVREKQRVFARETAIFATKCGLSFERAEAADGEDGAARDEREFEAALAFLPDAIPAVEAEDVFAHDRASYAAHEEAQWQREIGALRRAADGGLTLTATGEYIFNDNFSGYDTAGAKLSLSWDGITASAGAYKPLGQNLLKSASSADKSDRPYFSLSATIALNSWRLARIKKKQDAIDAQLEDIEVDAADDSYETDILDKVSSFHDILWARGSYREEYDMYSALEADMARWLKQGIVTESDWRDARNNRDKAKLNMLINAVELLVYNNETKLMFRDSPGAAGGTD